MAPTPAQIKKIAGRVHPEYKELVGHWRFLLSTYEGGRAWFTKDNIFRYFKEGEKEFNQRLSRAYRFNHTREVVDLVNKYLFRGEVNRRLKDAPKSVLEFWNNVDRSGVNINQFMRAVSKEGSIQGCPWIIIDNSERYVEGSTSREDDEGQIYAYIVRPEQVRDLSWGEDGELNWIVIEEYVRDDDDPFEGSGDTKTRLRLWTRQEWYLFEEKRKGGTFQFVDSDKHNLGVVPAVRADNIDSDEKWSVPALINDIAYLDRAIANYLSNLDAIIQDQTFSQLAIPAQNLLPPAPDDDDENAQDYNRLVEMGTKRVFVFDGENGAQPFFLSPDPKQAELLISAVRQIINEIYHSVGLAGERTKEDNSKGIDNSSGVAKAKDFERVNSLLLAKAKTLQLIEEKIVRIVALYAGDEDKIKDMHYVEYPQSFDVRQLFDEFDVAMQLSLLDMPAMMRSEHAKTIIDKLFPSASEAQRKQLVAAVERWGEDLKEQSELGMESQRLGVKATDAANRLAEEASRDRSGSGRRQSATKTRQENRRSESDQENGQ